nr:hypothetical protein GCM10020093_041790 [Planobispora longispora]
MGAVFGAVDLITVAFAEERGVKPAAGLLLAAIASGSLISGLWYGARRWEASCAAGSSARWRCSRRGSPRSR